MRHIATEKSFVTDINHENHKSPTKPDAVNDGNWIQTDPNKSRNVLLRLYSLLEPFFTKKWRPRGSSW